MFNDMMDNGLTKAQPLPGDLLMPKRAILAINDAIKVLNESINQCLVDIREGDGIEIEDMAPGIKEVHVAELGPHEVGGSGWGEPADSSATSDFITARVTNNPGFSSWAVKAAQVEWNATSKAWDTVASGMAWGGTGEPELVNLMAHGIPSTAGGEGGAPAGGVALGDIIMCREYTDAAGDSFWGFYAAPLGPGAMFTSGVRTFSANGTFTIPGAVRRYMAILIGGGGGGGGGSDGGENGNDGSGFAVHIGGAGGAGGNSGAVAMIVASNTRTEIDVVIGAGGSGGAADGNGSAGAATALKTTTGTVIAEAPGGNGGAATTFSNQGGRPALVTQGNTVSGSNHNFNPTANGANRQHWVTSQLGQAGNNPPVSLSSVSTGGLGGRGGIPGYTPGSATPATGTNNWKAGWGGDGGAGGNSSGGAGAAGSDGEDGAVIIFW